MNQEIKFINTLCGMMIDIRKGFLKRRFEWGDGLKKFYFLLNTTYYWIFNWSTVDLLGCVSFRCIYSFSDIFHYRLLQDIAYDCLCCVLPWWLRGKESACQCRSRRSHRRHGFDPWVKKIPCSRKWQSPPILLQT